MRRLLAIIAVVGLGVLGACSDSKGTAAPTSSTATTSTVPASLTRAAFIEKANAICAASNAEIAQLIDALFASGQPTPEAMQQVLDQIVAKSRQVTDDIDALAEPAELSGPVSQMVASLKAANTEADAQTGEQFFDTSDDPWAEATAMAKDMGLDVCGSTDD